MLKKKIMVVMVLLTLIPAVFATDIPVSFELGNAQTLNVTATVSTSAFGIGTIEFCDGTCASTKTIDPATQFTIKVTMNNDDDINSSGFDAYFYQTNDTNESSSDWDNIKKYGITSANADGCEATGLVYCLTISEGEWTTKFIAGTADVWVKAETTTSLEDFGESIGNLTISNATAIILDSSTATYSVTPNTMQNQITTDQANPYIEITHNGNINLDLNTIGADFVSGGNTIDKGNQKYNTTNNYGGATAIDGTVQIFLTDMNRGTYPTSSLRNLWLWLDCPDQQPKGTYTSTLTIGAEAS